MLRGYNMEIKKRLTIEIQTSELPQSIVNTLEPFDLCENMPVAYVKANYPDLYHYILENCNEQLNALEIPLCAVDHIVLEDC